LLHPWFGDAEGARELDCITMSGKRGSASVASFAARLMRGRGIGHEHLSGKPTYQDLALKHSRGPQINYVQSPEATAIVCSLMMVADKLKADSSPAELQESLRSLHSKFWALTIFVLVGLLLSVALRLVRPDHPPNWAIAAGRRGWFSDWLSIALLGTLAILGVALWCLTAMALARAIRALKAAGHPASWPLLVLSVFGGPPGAMIACGLFMLTNRRISLR